MPATETRLSEILRQILSRTYTGLQLNVDKTLLGLFTSFVGRREFALSVVETTCLEETLFKVVRACMRKTVLRMILLTDYCHRDYYTTLRDFIFIGIIKLSCFYFAISYLFAKRTPTKIENCAVFGSLLLLLLLAF